MTIAANDDLFSGPYDGTGSTGPFDYDFVIFGEDELTVRKEDASGAVTTLTPTTDYTVSPTGGSYPAKGTITLTSALEVGERLTITPNVSLSQDRPFSSQGSITLTEIEDALDKVTALVRQLEEKADRAVTISQFDDVADLEQLQQDILSVAAIDSEISAVAADSADIGVVAADLGGDDDIGTVATNIASITEVAGLFPSGASEPGLAWLAGTQVPFIGNASVTDDSIEIGAYAYATSQGSSGGPATVTAGNFLHLRRSFGGELQILVPDIPATERDRIYVRTRLTGGWSSWRRALDSSDNYLTTEWRDGTETNLAAISPAKLAAAVPLFREYESAAQTITPGGLLTLTHGLGVEPKLIRLEIVCIAAQAGFAVGDKVDLNTLLERATGGASTTGVVVSYDDTEIKVRFGDSAVLLHTTDFGSGSSQLTLTKANWNCIVRAWG